MKDNRGQVWNRGAGIHYETVGDGMPLIMLHGNGGDKEDFRGLIDYFLPRYQIVLIDSRGHGRSDTGPLRLTTGLMAEDVLAVMDRLGLPSAVVLGFSDGANIALELAVQSPHRVRAVIAVSGNVHPRGIRALPYLFIRLQYRLWSFLEKLGIPVGSRTQRYGLMGWSPRLSEEELSRIDSPVLLLAGTRDLIRTGHTQQMAAWIPGASLVLFKGAHHRSLFKKTDSYIRQIRGFLKEYDL